MTTTRRRCGSPASSMLPAGNTRTAVITLLKKKMSGATCSSTFDPIPLCYRLCVCKKGDCNQPTFGIKGYLLFKKCFCVGGGWKRSEGGGKGTCNRAPCGGGQVNCVGRPNVRGCTLWKSKVGTEKNTDCVTLGPKLTWKEQHREVPLA